MASKTKASVPQQRERSDSKPHLCNYFCLISRRVSFLNTHFYFHLKVTSSCYISSFGIETISIWGMKLSKSYFPNHTVIIFESNHLEVFSGSKSFGDSFSLKCLPYPNFQLHFRHSTEVLFLFITFII